MTTPTLDRSYGYPIIHQFGRNPTVGMEWQDIWSAGGTYSWPTEPSEIEAISDNVNDAPGGSGARAIRVIGLDEDWNPLEAIITMEGALPTSRSIVKFMRINHAWVVAAGTYSNTDIGGNEGNITVRFVSDGSTQAFIPHESPVGMGESEMCRFSVRDKSRVYIQNIHIQNGGLQPSDLVLFQRRRGEIVEAPFSSKRVVQHWPRVNDIKPITLVCPLGPFPGFTDLWMAGMGSGGMAAIGASMEILQVDGDDP